jgi:hypothetical protein
MSKAISLIKIVHFSQILRPNTLYLLILLLLLYNNNNVLVVIETFEQKADSELLDARRQHPYFRNVPASPCIFLFEPLNMTDIMDQPRCKP